MIGHDPTSKLKTKEHIMFLHDQLARGHLDQRHFEGQLSPHAVRVIAARRAQRLAERSAYLASMLNRIGVSNGPSLD